MRVLVVCGWIFEKTVGNVSVRFSIADTLPGMFTVLADKHVVDGYDASRMEWVVVELSVPGFRWKIMGKNVILRA